MVCLVLLCVASLLISTQRSQPQAGLSLKSATNSNCSKPWFVTHDNETKCTCGSSLGGVITCSDSSVEIEPCYCMTVDEDTNKTAVGICPYACVEPCRWNPNPTLLNEGICSERWKRAGRLCSQCMDDHGPLVYSYNIQCTQCHSSVARDSIAVFIVTFILLTVFCLAIITLRISGAKPPISTFILVCQVMSGSQYILLTLAQSHYNSYASQTVHEICWKIFVTFFGLWNLDICRSCFPQICLSPNMTTLQAQLLEYVIAFFPLTILIVVFFSVKLYDRGYRIIFWVCRPVYSCFARLRRTIDVQTSLIDAFVTFIILSQNKIGYTSFRVLQPVNVYSPDGTYSVFVYIDPSIKYFGWDHLPYALPALAFVVVFILIPLLLLFLYPLRSFQTFLNNCQWQCSALHIFADTFQGCYKNGTNGTRDYRWFAGLHLLMRFVIVAFYDFTRYRQITSISMTIVLSFYMAVQAVLQPYKRHIHLKLDMMLLFGLLLWNTAVLVGSLTLDGGRLLQFVLHLILLVFGSLIPFLYFTGHIIYWLLVVKKLHRWIIVKLRTIFHSEDQIHLLDHTS